VHSSAIDLASVGEGKQRTAEGDGAQADNVSYTGPGSTTPSAGGSAEGSIATFPSAEDLGATTRMLRDKYPKPEECVYVYVTIQLYSIEKEFFLVDFKCAGYESLERKFVREIRVQGHGVHELGAKAGKKGEWRRLKEGEAVPDQDGVQIREREELVPHGHIIGDKNATSPFPFLDVASGLIIQLAEGSD